MPVSEVSTREQQVETCASQADMYLSLALRPSSIFRAYFSYHYFGYITWYSLDYRAPGRAETLGERRALILKAGTDEQSMRGPSKVSVRRPAAVLLLRNCPCSFRSQPSMVCRDNSLPCFFPLRVSLCILDSKISTISRLETPLSQEVQAQSTWHTLLSFYDFYFVPRRLQLKKGSWPLAEQEREYCMCSMLRSILRRRPV